MKNLLLFGALALCLNSFGQGNYFESGMAHWRSKNYISAISDLTKVIETEEDGNVMESLYIRALCKEKVGDYRGALKDYNTLFLIMQHENEPETEAIAVVYLQRGYIRIKLEDYEGAEGDFTRAIELKNNYGEAFMNRGIIRTVLGFTKGACLDFSRAGELGISEAYEMIKDNCLE